MIWLNQITFYILKATCNQQVGRVVKSPTHIKLLLLYMAHLRQKCHSPKLVIFQEKRLEVLKCYTFLRVQRRHNCSPAASFTNCVMTLYLLKVYLQTSSPISITQKCSILCYDTLIANERYMKIQHNDLWVYVSRRTLKIITSSKNTTFVGQGRMNSKIKGVHTLWNNRYTLMNWTKFEK